MTPEPSFSKLLRAAQAQSIARDCATESGANRLVVIPARRRVGPRPMTVSARGPRVRIGNFAVHQGREVGILKRAAVGGSWTRTRRRSCPATSSTTGSSSRRPPRFVGSVDVTDLLDGRVTLRVDGYPDWVADLDALRPQ